MKNFIGIMPFEAPLYGEASKIVGRDYLPKYKGNLPVVTNGVVHNMPSPQEGVVYVVNAFVLSALKGTRTLDVVGFDPALTNRSVVDGKPFTTQGGFIA